MLAKFTIKWRFLIEKTIMQWPYEPERLWVRRKRIFWYLRIHANTKQTNKNGENERVLKMSKNSTHISVIVYYVIFTRQVRSNPRLQKIYLLFKFVIQDSGIFGVTKQQFIQLLAILFNPSKHKEKIFYRRLCSYLI